VTKLLAGRFGVRMQEGKRDVVSSKRPNKFLSSVCRGSIPGV